MKKKIIALFSVMMLVVCMLPITAFAGESKKAEFDFANPAYQTAHPVIPPTIAGEPYNLEINDNADIGVKVSALEYYGGEGIAYTNDSTGKWVHLAPKDSTFEITAAEGYKITGVRFNLARCDWLGNIEYYGFTVFYEKNGAGEIIQGSEYANDFVAKANGAEVSLTSNKTDNYEEYIPAETDTVTSLIVSSKTPESEYWPYLGKVEVTYEAVKTNDVPQTADTSEPLIMAGIAVMAAGIFLVLRKKTN